MKLQKTLLSVLCTSAILTTSMAVQATSKGTIYLTFDDGPLNASIPVIDVLNEGGIKGTFYVNGWHLDGIGDENEDKAVDALKYMLDSGHVVGNHSYDHMVHNCVDENGDNSAAACNATGNHQIDSYQDPVYDASMFDKNLTVIESYIQNVYSYPNFKGVNLARLPYTNGWRVTKDFKGDGLCATSDEFKPWEPGYVCDPQNPSQSVQSSMKVADILTGKNYQLHGWDVDWAPENWGIPMPANSLTEADVFLGYIDAAINACAPTTIEPVNSKTQTFPCGTSLHADKVIVLTHEFLFEDGKRGMGATKNLPKLAKFIKIAKEAGYVFDTIDNYAPVWSIGETYEEGDYVTHEDTIYKATVAHNAQADWAPSSTSSLWLNSMPTTVWTLNVSYNQGDIVLYMNERYLVNTAHTSQADWTPNTEATLFTKL
ncbi:carbohydrate-binding protein [Photobacterium profundum]|uniref:carbohydrate-binding protein n=1 Tax=Photobacterium profundum TaxID=74109 RepID=UPI003D0D51DA